MIKLFNITMKDDFEDFSSQLECILLNQNKLKVLFLARKYFSNIKIEDFSFFDLPNKAVDYLNSRKEKNSGFDLNILKSDFLKTYQVLFADNSRIYFTYQKYYYSNYQDVFMYFLDCYFNDEFRGYGVIRYSLDDEESDLDNIKSFSRFTENPIIEYAFTKSEFRRQGLTQRRLILMDCFTKGFFNKCLYSGSVTSNESRSLWEKLVEKRLVEEAEDLFGSLYKFR